MKDFAWKLTAMGAAALLLALALPLHATEIGKEVAVKDRLADGQEYEIPVGMLLSHGRTLFNAIWTNQEGGGRPMTKGTGGGIADPSDPLVFPRNFNRVSAPDSNSCAGCHNAPFSGGEGDIVGNVFVLGQRFDFATFGGEDSIPTKSSVNERGEPVTLDDIANSRATTGMFGGGYYEMLARQITADLQAIRNATQPGQARQLVSKGISFGTIARAVDGSWDVSGVEGLAAPSVRSTGPADPPSLVIRPWHQAGAVVSIREFTNNAMNHHHGMQTTERFGIGTDPDGDGHMNEISRAEMTAVSVWQATLPVPGQVIPNDPEIEAAIVLGKQKFMQVGCGTCHVPALPLDGNGHVYTEPDPYNPNGNLQPGQAPEYAVDLNDRQLPGPRLRQDPATGVTWVPAFTDLKLHDITSGPDDPNREALNMHFAAGSDEFFAGNSRFLTKRLWGAGNTPPYFHHGKFTTMRLATLAHAGEAEASRQAFEALTDYEQDSIIEFLKSLQVLPAGVKSLVVDENFRPRWAPAP